MKTKAHAPSTSGPTLERIQTRDVTAVVPTLHKHPQSTFLPRCMFCQYRIDFLEEATMLLSGQWVPNAELGEPVFLLEVDAPLKFIQMANGQYALVSEENPKAAQVVRHAHDECLERLRLEVAGYMEYEPFG